MVDVWRPIGLTVAQVRQAPFGSRQPARSDADYQVSNFPAQSHPECLRLLVHGLDFGTRLVGDLSLLVEISEVLPCSGEILPGGCQPTPSDTDCLRSEQIEAGYK